jgi:inosine-uridine nucleoside N-ribohydrolase
LRRDPQLAEHARWVGMHGSFDIGYGGAPKPAAESNVKVDPASLRVVLAAHWRDALITPLDTCGTVELTGENYLRVWCATDDPLLRGVIEGYCIFAPHQTWFNCDFFATKSTTLFDCVAVYLASAEDLVTIETLHVGVTNDGLTRRDPAGAAIRVALHWKNRGAFESQLSHRLLKR